MKEKTREDMKKLLVTLSALNQTIASFVESSGGTMEKVIISEEGAANSPAALTTATSEETKQDSQLGDANETCAKCGGKMDKAAEGSAVSCPGCTQRGTAGNMGKELEEKSMTAQISEQKTDTPDLTDDMTNASTETVVEPVVAEAAVVEPVTAESTEAATTVDTTVVIQEKRTDDYETGTYTTQRMTQEVTVVSNDVAVDAAPATAVAAEEKETDKEEKDEKEVDKKDETAKAELSDQTSASETVVENPFETKFTTEAVAKIGLSEAEASLVVGHSFIDLVKVIASLTQEVTLHREQAKTAEFARVTEARVDELTALGIKLELSEGSSDRERIASMDEVAFASYRDGVRDVQKSVASAEPKVEVKGKTVEQAKASLAGLSAMVPLAPNSRKSKFAQI